MPYMAVVQEELEAKQNELKLKAARAAIRFVKPGMRLGLGSGSTAEIFIRELAKEKDIIESLVCVATSYRTELLAKNLGLKVALLYELGKIDLAVDGADRVTADGTVLKGWGGAFRKEKIVGYSADMFIVIIDESKFVKDTAIYEKVPLGVTHLMGNNGPPRVLRCLSDFGIPIECITTRMNAYQIDKPFMPDGGGYVLDVKIDLSDVYHAIEWEEKLGLIPDTTGNGLFTKFEGEALALIAYDNGMITFDIKQHGLK